MNDITKDSAKSILRLLTASVVTVFISGCAIPLNLSSDDKPSQQQQSEMPETEMPEKTKEPTDEKVTDGLSKKDLADYVSQAIQQTYSTKADSVDCESGLSGAPDATATCTVDLNSLLVDVEIKPKSVGTEIKYPVLPVEGTQKLKTDKLVKIVQAEYKSKTNDLVTEISCPKPIYPVRNGSSFMCSYTSKKGANGKIRFIVTKVKGLNVSFKWKTYERSK